MISKSDSDIYLPIRRHWCLDVTLSEVAYDACSVLPSLKAVEIVLSSFLPFTEYHGYPGEPTYQYSYLSMCDC